MNSITSFTLTDHLGHAWHDELVTFPILDLAPELHVAIADEQGDLLPCQRLVNDGVPHLAFRVKELPPLGTRTYFLVEAKACGTPPEAHLEGGTVELSNGLISVRLPATQALTTGAPAPVLAVRRGEGPWIGSGRMLLSPHLQPLSLESREIEAGPLWRTWELTYRCAGGVTCPHSRYHLLS